MNSLVRLIPLTSWRTSMLLIGSCRRSEADQWISTKMCRLFGILALTHRGDFAMLRTSHPIGHLNNKIQTSRYSLFIAISIFRPETGRALSLAIHQPYSYTEIFSSIFFSTNLKKERNWFTCKFEFYPEFDNHKNLLRYASTASPLPRFYDNINIIQGTPAFSSIWAFWFWVHENVLPVFSAKGHPPPPLPFSWRRHIRSPRSPL